MSEMNTKQMVLVLATVMAGIAQGCASMQHPILICPDALRESDQNWTSLRERLFELDGTYWVTDDAGRPVHIYRYRHDYIPIIEPSVMLEEDNSKSRPQHIASPIILKQSRKNIVVHLLRNGKETTIPLGTAVIERRGDYDVLRIP